MKRSILLLILSTLILSTVVFAQPQGIHLSWNSTKKEATENTMAITWSTNKLNEGTVKYGMDSGFSKTQKAVGHYSDSAGVYIYKTTLTRLKPNTAYYYQCGSDADGWSKTYTFQTAPPTGSKDKFVVGVWGDTQDNEFNTHFEQTDTIVHQLQQYPIQFTIHMGDIVDNGSVVDKWRGFFNTAQPVNTVAPFMPVTGNHDVNNNEADTGFQKPFPIFYEFMNLPGNHINYSFNYGNTHFVAISSGHAKGAENAGNFTFAKDSPEYQWLEDDLSKARKDHKITWIVLYMHHPLYSFGWSHVAGWEQRITPLVDKYQVDLCLAGHRHVYERHKALRNNQVIPQQDSHVYQKPAGTVYITNGTAGGSPQGLGGSDMPSMIFTNPVKTYNYAIMAIEGNTITYDVYNGKGEKTDYFKLLK